MGSPPSVPIVPLLQVSEREYGVYEHFTSYPWVQPIYHYHDLDELLHSIQEHIIDPCTGYLGYPFQKLEEIYLSEPCTSPS
jgi:hypothetical protein